MKKFHVGHLLGGMSLLALGLTVGMLAKAALASRNAAGTDSNINGPYVSGTTISSALVNARFADAETEITNSLDRNGRGGMLADLRGIDGTLAAPAYSWTSETGSGLFRNGANDIRMSVGAGLRQNWTSTGSSVTGTFGATGVATLSGTAIASGGTTTPTIQVTGAGQTVAAVTTNATLGGAITLDDTGAASGNGGMVVFGASQGRWAAIKGFIASGANNTTGDLVFATRAVSTDAALTERMRLTSAGLTIGSGTATSSMRHQRFGTMCTTAVGVGAGCTTTHTWTIAFPDTNYTVTCTGFGNASGSPMSLTITTKSATQIQTVTTNNSGINAGQFTDAECIAFHD